MTKLQIGSVDITATPAQINKLAGVTSTANELNLVNGASAGNINNSKAVIYGTNGEVNAKTLKLDGVSVTVGADKINMLDNATSNIQTQLNAKLSTSDASSTYGVKEGSSDIVTVGALASGSIVNGFTKIEMTGPITTTGQISGGSLDVDDVVISGSTLDILTIQD